ncbi:SCP2 domain-containing protein [Reinekea sp.]|jgi:ubiquinone biosynthesis protein UbiJ|uniref:ubiquinone biosynthesis accessory factor UbiJ n=1 Tax=Reinekea sp. TaxID=1970455 RepID=UPI002A805DF3|nr:SCP2 sterol-binding domain-containing protein [Reinekea sp.]
MSAWLWPVQKLVNDALAYDPVAQQKIIGLAGKTLLLVLTEPPLAISLSIEANGLVLLHHGQIDTYDARVAGTALDLLAVLRATDRTAAMMAHEINIEGDTRTFFAIQDVLSHLDIDWEMAIGDKIGDLAAHVVADGLRFFGGMAREHFASASRTSRNYWREESGLLVPSDLWQTHQSQVQAARNDVERMAAKINRFAERLASTNSAL